MAHRRWTARRVLMTAMRFQMFKRELRSDMSTKLQGNPIAGMARLMTEAVQLQFGRAVVIIRAGLLITAAVISQRFARA
jgi:hypothetical protein